MNRGRAQTVRLSHDAGPTVPPGVPPAPDRRHFPTVVARVRSGAMETLLDLLEESAARYADRNALGLRRDDGTTFHWSYRRCCAAAASPRGASARSGCSPATAS